MKIEKYHHGDLKNALVRAGIDILAQEGIQGLSLRQVAKRAGVSHSAPYAHFKDKQALLAAISTKGFQIINTKFIQVAKAFADDPWRQLVEVGWAYLDFSQRDPDLFKVIFSGMLEYEYPDFTRISHENFDLVVGIVEKCQKTGSIKGGDPTIAAVGLWSLVHGFACLLMQNQISHSILGRQPARELLIRILQQTT